MSNLEFQSQTGFPGHLALATARESISALMFQSQTGFPGHLALKDDDLWGAHFVVSIPDGLPRPFSPGIFLSVVSRNWMFQSQTGFPGHLAWEFPLSFRGSLSCFNPRRASQAI